MMVKFKIFDDKKIYHGFTERTFQEKEFSFNLKKEVELATVKENIKTLVFLSGDEGNVPVIVSQVHGKNIAKVDESTNSFGKPSDGMITNVPGKLLITFYADCTPVWIHDPVNNAVAVVHAGWKGTSQKIVSEAVLAMSRSYGSIPGDLIAAIGPCIDVCHFEVSDNFMDGFDDREFFDRFMHKTHQNAHFDLKGANKALLLDAGVKEENIEVSELCTHCREDEFFSYRREGEKAGRMAAFIMLR